MKKVSTLISAVALAAAFVAPAAAQDLPLNSTVSGGQGEVAVNGQAGLALAGLSGTTLAVVGVLVVTTFVAAASGASTTN
jgi:hypothetical protein